MHRKIARFGVASVAILLCLQSSAFADSCVRTNYPRTEAGEIRQDYRESDAVFSGELLEVTPDHGMVFQVSRRWKGVKTPRVVVKDYSMASPRTFTVGDSYLIFGL